jgi:hypothetical protein
MTLAHHLGKLATRMRMRNAKTVGKERSLGVQVRSASAEDHDGASASVSPLITKQEVKTQMHADKKGCTRMVCLHGHRVGHWSMESILLPLRASLLIGVDLRFRFLDPRGTGAALTKDCHSACDAAVTLWCAPGCSDSAHWLVGTVAVVLGAISADSLPS